MGIKMEGGLNEDLALCCKEGFRAFIKHLGQDFENPYGPGTEAHFAFHAGWHFAMKSVSAQIVTVPPRRKLDKARLSVRPRSQLPAVVRTH